MVTEKGKCEFGLYHSLGSSALLRVVSEETGGTSPGTFRATRRWGSPSALPEGMPSSVEAVFGNPCPHPGLSVRESVLPPSS